VRRHEKRQKQKVVCPPQFYENQARRGHPFNNKQYDRRQYDGAAGG